MSELTQNITFWVRITLAKRDKSSYLYNKKEIVQSFSKSLLSESLFLRVK